MKRFSISRSVVAAAAASALSVTGTALIVPAVAHAAEESDNKGKDEEKDPSAFEVVKEYGDLAKELSKLAPKEEKKEEKKAPAAPAAAAPSPAAAVAPAPAVQQPATQKPNTRPVAQAQSTKALANTGVSGVMVTVAIAALLLAVGAVLVVSRRKA